MGIYVFLAAIGAVLVFVDNHTEKKEEVKEEKAA